MLPEEQIRNRLEVSLEQYQEYCEIVYSQGKTHFSFMVERFEGKIIAYGRVLEMDLGALRDRLYGIVDHYREKADAGNKKSSSDTGMSSERVGKNLSGLV